MKLTYKFICALFILAVAGSCNDAIDITQPGRLDADAAFQDVGDLQLGLLGAYNFFDTTYEIGFTAPFTDESYRGTENGGQNLGLLNFNLNSTNGYAYSIWATNYGAIGMANRILKASEGITPDDSVDGETTEDFNNIVGQAYAIRAFGHFSILTWFSTDYTDDSALAGLLLTEPTEDIFARVPRSTNGEFYAQIESDLDMAETLITEDNGVYYMGDDFIKALRARIAAYKEDYTTAAMYADELLADYPIADQSQYYNMYEDSDFTEVIFSLQRAIGDSYDGQGTSGGGWAGSLFAFVDPTADGSPYMEMSRSVYNLLEGTTDIRLQRNLNMADSSIDPSYDTNPNFLNSDVLIVYKYPGGAQPLLNDLKVFRSAEMLLIRAEAAVAAGDLTGAATLIKTLRDARYGSSQTLPTYSSATEAWGDILDERRIEFLFEGHRYIDLKRLGAKGNRSIDRDPRECSFFSCDLTNTDYRFTMPIPNAEITANSEATQNPGY